MADQIEDAKSAEKVMPARRSFRYTAFKSCRRIAPSQEVRLPDVEQLLPDLNEARKSAAYGDVPAPDLNAEHVTPQLVQNVHPIQSKRHWPKPPAAGAG